MRLIGFRLGEGDVESDDVESSVYHDIMQASIYRGNRGMNQSEGQTNRTKTISSINQINCASFTAYRLRELCNGAEPTDGEIEHLRKCETCRTILQRSFSLFG